MKKYKNCVLLGKFMPPHKGHEYMIRFAKEFAENTHVIVDCLEGQTICPELRVTWLREEIGGVNFYPLKKFMPQEPEDCTNFWEIWISTIESTLSPIKPDLVVASMDYGWELAKRLNCDFIPCDIARESISISATLLREDIYSYWDFLLPSAREYFLKKVCLLGPESTGKSVLGKKIANHFNTVYVPEYAKATLEKQGGEFLYENVSLFEKGQVATEKALSKFANKVMLCDSSAITTKIYSQLVFNRYPQSLDSTIKNHTYDLYCLFYPDVAFTVAEHRKVLGNPIEERLNVFALFEKELIENNLPYVVISGDWENREKTIINEVKKLIKIV